MTDEEVFTFVQSAIPSVWALELLQVMYRRRERTWRTSDLVAELRSSPSAIEHAAAALNTAGLIAVEGSTYRFHPASDAVAQLAARTLELYAVRPAWVIRAIMTAPNDKLRIFANSFRLKD
ncbi:MAG: hypothetical protein ACM30I_04985 [Gemmatimonas sp.]